MEWSRKRGTPSDHAQQGLLSGVRDFDLFEWAVFRYIAQAIGYKESELSVRRPYFRSKPHHILNCNVEGASSHRKRLLPGWRDNTIQPSDFRPDVVVIYEGTVPILVDAKFRCGSSDKECVPGDAVKEIQAYMDEFGRRSAILVVPLIPYNLIRGDRGYKAINASFDSTRKAIFVVELNPMGIARFQEDFLEALKQCAEIEQDTA